ncbi:MAG TPA: discoidin domain-containing protein [Steroidobacteraceae bacterium]|nr:discoidin domain-containing protein [Steroidobacteraceae bacterium]
MHNIAPAASEKSIRVLPALVLGFLLASCSTPTELPHAPAETVAAAPPPPPNIKALSPEASIATMQMPKGYRLEPVLTEPQIAEPVMIAFDGNGRMYVAEMRSYMMDADGTGEQTLVSRISRHEDTDGDGVYDKHTVFADKLLLPRILLTLDDRVIIGETNSDDLYIYRDSDGDGVADEKTLWFKGGPRGGNMEHQPNGLVWAMDNGLYSTYHDYRLRFGPDGKAVKETIPVNGGQWGLTQDDFGKVWFVNAGNETGPVHFQQHIVYGQFTATNELIGQYKVVWPIAHMPDTQGGIGELRSDNTLNHFTATCGQDIFRGDRLPAELRGNLLFAEPVGRLIRRTQISVEDGVTRLANVYEDQHSEFIRATDPFFRPINMVTAPDGTLYIVDMYRGIIQQANWTQKGSYLREQIEAHELQKEIGRGRIYRLRHESLEPGPQPHMLDETPAAWVQHLSHPNGWWRDTAQKLLVLRRDLSVVPALEKLASQDSTDPRPRLHALWTLDGLGALNDKLILRALKATDPQVRMAGLRLADSRVNAKSAAHAPLVVALRGALRDADPRVDIQAMLSVRRAGLPDAQKIIRATAEKSASVGVYAINEQLWDEANNEDPQLIRLLGVNGLKSYRAGSTLYKSVCFACHGTDGRGAPKPGAEGSTIAPPLAGSSRVLGDERATIAIVLHGLQGAVDGVDYGAPMVPMNSYSDAELAGVLTYVRNSFGNRAPAIAPEAVAARRAADAAHANYWTLAELTGQLPALGLPRERFKRRAEWKLVGNMAARDNSPLEAMLDGDPKTGYYTQDVKPFPLEWLTIELPARSKIVGIDIDSRGERSPEGKEIGWAPFYSVEVSDDGKAWTMIDKKVAGEPHARLNLAAPIEARYLRIAITEKESWQAWVIKELNLFGDEG